MPDLAVVSPEEQPLSAVALREQVNIIQQVMREVMKEGEHYGQIPGTDKPSLYKPGAEKLSLTFRLAPRYHVEPMNLPNGHREYSVTCELYHIHSGTFLGTGVGSCSTMESKYRWRWDFESTGKTVPRDYWKGRDAALLGGRDFVPKKDDDGRWMIFKKGQRIENPDIADQYNCVTADTKLLTRDLQWVPAGEIKTGDRLIGVEEELTNEYARHFSVGEATVYGNRLDDLYEVTFSDGRIVRCNAEHQWLVKKVGLKGTEWVSTQDIYVELVERKGRPRNWSVMSVCVPWTEDRSKIAGYIAGLLDADGSLAISQLGVLFAQQSNGVLAMLQDELTERGYRLAAYPIKTQQAVNQSVSQQQVYHVRVLGGFSEQIRLLGTIRPPRLLDRWANLFDLKSRRLEGRGSGAGSPVGISSIQPIGQGEIVMLGTSCRTYLAEGLVCHNTCLKMAKKRAHVDAVLTATAASDIFTQAEETEEDEPKPEPKKATSPRRQSDKDAIAKTIELAQKQYGLSQQDLEELTGTPADEWGSRESDIIANYFKQLKAKKGGEQRAAEEKGEAEPQGEKSARLTDPHKTELRKALKESTAHEDDFNHWVTSNYTVKSWEELPDGAFDTALDWLQSQKAGQQGSLPE